MGTQQSTLSHDKVLDIDAHLDVLTDEEEEYARKGKRCMSLLSGAQLPGRAGSDSGPGSAVHNVPKESALLAMAALGTSNLVAQFGGQGYNWLTELSELYKTQPVVGPLLEVVSVTLQEHVRSIHAQVLGFYRHGLDFMAWVRSPESAPPASYLTSTPISYPMVCVTQLAHYLVCVRLLGKSPGDIADHFSAVIGHSQGIVAAVIASSSTTQDDFFRRTQSGVSYLFWHGARVQQASPCRPIGSKLLRESKERGWGTPTPMLSVRGLSSEVLQDLVAKVNKSISPLRKVYVSLVNGIGSNVVGGDVHTLHNLRTLLAAIQAKPGDSQARIPFSQRKKTFHVRYLPISAPFHTPLLAPAIDLILADIERLGIAMTANDLRVPVLSTNPGTAEANLQQSKDLMQELVELQCVQAVHWPEVCHRINFATHVLAFGPGGISGTGRLTQENLEGTGTLVIMCGLEGAYGTTPTRDVLTEVSEEHVPHGVNWVDDFAPQLLLSPEPTRPVDGNGGDRDEAEPGKAHYSITNKFTRVFGKPPVLVAGMTPCTVGEQFCSAVTIAGYNVELAGGGQPREHIFRKRIADLTALIPQGEGITINLLYLNVRQWKFQFPLVLKMRQEGWPIESITIAAGVPSSEKASDILSALANVGIRRVGFKPGSQASIKEVVDIARANPKTDVVLQWTGGQAGGHHSAEDQYAPMLAMYADIRQVSNIVLVAGGGIGDSTSALPYIIGEWSVPHGYPPMPFDGVLVASRVMVAKEAPTAQAVKELICETPGVAASDWERSYTAGGAGGVLTLQSELGEAIHKIDNKGSRFWRTMDEQFFSLPKAEFLAKLKERRSWIIQGLNSNYQKPFFALLVRGDDGEPQHRLSLMTYGQVAQRMVALMCPGGDWLDPTFAHRFNDFVIRCIERLAPSPDSDEATALLPLLDDTTDATPVLKLLSQACPNVATAVLTPEDEMFFVSLCKRRGKPVNFVPVIDVDLRFWMKKDSLWYSEDLRSVPGQDAQRVMILQGPVSTRFSIKPNESVRQVLDDISNGLVQRLAAMEGRRVMPFAHARSLDISEEDVLSMLCQFVVRARPKQDPAIRLRLSIPLHHAEDVHCPTWFALLGGTVPSWRRVLVASDRIVRGKKWIPNYLSEMFAPRPGQTVELRSRGKFDNEIVSIHVFHKSLTEIGLPVDVAAVEAHLLPDERVSITLRHPRCDYDSYVRGGEDPPAELTLSFTHKLSVHGEPHGWMAEEPWSVRCENVANFYRSLWCTSSKANGDCEMIVSADAIRRFRAAIGDGNREEGHVAVGVEVAPLDFGIVLAWEPIVQALLLGVGKRYGQADLLSLVHLSNEFIVGTDAHGCNTTPVRSGDRLTVTAELTGVWDEPEGRTISVLAKIVRHPDEEGVMQVLSRFAIRQGQLESSQEQRQCLFRTSTEHWELDVPDARTLAVLRSKTWHDSKGLREGQSLQCTLRTHETRAAQDKLVDIRTVGELRCEGVLVGQVSHEAKAVSGCVVRAFMQRFSKPSTRAKAMEEAQYYPPQSLLAPSSNFVYALASKDVNPIHLNPYSVALARLPATIVHGMYSSAQGRLLMRKLGNGRVCRYKASFTGMVLPGVSLSAKTFISGMRNGKKCLKLELRDQNNLLVQRSSGEVDQPATSYYFTGQGSAVRNMGMELYTTSSPGSPARNVWDVAEAHFLGKYGFSIMHIIKDNPTRLVVSLKGPHGDRIRANYGALVVDKAGGATTLLFPQTSDPQCSEIVFQSEEGLLFQTQFQQPAILLTEKAAFVSLAERGVIVENTAFFAGHSLGEYAALGCMVSSLSVAQLADIVFLRGLTMQSAVPRDELSRSRYGMVAVSPARVGPWFSADMLAELVDEIDSGSEGKLCQIVNYNIEALQYVVAGDLLCLECLRLALDGLRDTPPNQVPALDLGIVVKTARKGARALLDGTADGFLPLQRGKATIPLRGIDVPFHSRVLMDGVPTFRKVLQRAFAREVDPGKVVNRYIPNLLGRPFVLERDFVQAILERTGSSIAKEVLEHWEQWLAKPRRLVSVLVVELLSYQFASPVQWISTQKYLLDQGVRRFVEVGPSPILNNMLKKACGHDRVLTQELELMWSDRDIDQICCLDEGSTQDPDDNPVSVSEDAPCEPAAAILPTAVSAAPIAAVSADAPPQRVRFSALHSLRTIVALKLKMSLPDVDPSKSVKALSGGKSALQNEIVGDLGAEFKAEPEGAEELPLTELASRLAATGYTKPGKVLEAQTARLLQRATPGGFGQSKVRGYLKHTFNMDDQTVDGCLIHALSMAPAKRLPSEIDATAWLDAVVTSFGSSAGTCIAKVAVGGPNAGSNSGGPILQVVDAKQVTAIQALLKQQHQALAAYLAEDSTSDPAGDNINASLPDALSLLQVEHGSKYMEGIRPMFDAAKIRRYSSWWAWGRQETVQLFNELRKGGSDVRSMAKRIYLISNRASEDLLDIIEQTNSVGCPRSQECALRLQVAIKRNLLKLDGAASYLEYRSPSLPKTEVTATGKVKFCFVPRYEKGFSGYVADMLRPENPNRLRVNAAIPLDPGEATMSAGGLEQTLRSAFVAMVDGGVCFQGKTALITGAGPGSIGAEVARCLLLGGCHVIVTTSRPQRRRWEQYRRLYRRFCGRDARLTVVPFNAASSQDVASLLDALFDPKQIGSGPPDFVLPFAAIPENGRDISRIDGQSELAHRAMMTNVVRLLGGLRERVRALDGTGTNSSLVLLPLSPNHGLFGGDGLYSESKIGLETLFAKWRSEGWGASLSLVGAVIGWTRGTGLMSTNDLIAEGIEFRTGLRTFDSTEMAFNIVALLTPPVVAAAQAIPLKVDLSGGFANKSIPAAELRRELMTRSEVAKAVHEDKLLDKQQQAAGTTIGKKPLLQSRANCRIRFPTLPPCKPGLRGKSSSDKHERNLHLLEGMLDLSTVAVVVGFGEVGPWGSARTRWEWEVMGRFSKEGAIELARAMGLIQFHAGPLRSTIAGQGAQVLDGEYVGWVDATTGVPVSDDKVVTTYGKYLSEHCGIRDIDPGLQYAGYDPRNKLSLQQVAMEADLPPFEVASSEELSRLKQRHGTLLETFREGDRTMARLKKGAVIYVPKLSVFDRQVAGQLPTGWDAQRYGLPNDLGVDRVTLYALAATMDAFASAGIADPYELYRHVHVSQVGNSAGGGMGGMSSLHAMFVDRLLGTKDVSSDVLQETFINTTPAWINMLLLSASGPIKTPVAACATAATSVEIGVETIAAGKARVMIVGGFEDFGEQGSYEFAQMKATSSSVAERAMGREPDEMCRPATATRSGFMESQGAGIQILMSAELAIEMGVPIYAVVAGTSTATDKEGRSVPAPGQGILTSAREVTADLTGYTNPLLDLSYRRSEFLSECGRLNRWRDDQVDTLQSRKETQKGTELADARAWSFVTREHDRRVKAAQRVWGSNFYQADPEISPLRGCLAVWGLGVDDLEAVSFHGTGTKANDENESHVINQQLQHLGRTEGKPIPAVFQKWMTGHPKGAAAAWMMNGLMQTMLAGVVPGNRNCDDVCATLRPFQHLLFLDQPLDVGRPLRAGYLHSFGFGQAGAEMVLVHPEHCLAVLDATTYTRYKAKRTAREQAANRHWLQHLAGQRALVTIKDHAPYTDEQEARTYLDPTSRATLGSDGHYMYAPSSSSPSASSASSTVDDNDEGIRVQTESKRLMQTLGRVGGIGLGVDVESVATFQQKDDIFLQRNFTERELAYCASRPNRAASLAARWCVKEAVIKAISSSSPFTANPWKSAGTPLLDIEVVMSRSGAPLVRLTGHAAKVAASANVQHFGVSISHTKEHAVAQVVAHR